MAAIYTTLIKDGAINPKTGEPWKVEDVNVIWRAKVQELLDADGE